MTGGLTSGCPEAAGVIKSTNVCIQVKPNQPARTRCSGFRQEGKQLAIDVRVFRAPLALSVIFSKLGGDESRVTRLLAN